MSAVTVANPDEIQSSTGEQVTATGDVTVSWDDPQEFIFMIAEAFQTFGTADVPNPLKYTFTKKLSVKSLSTNLSSDVLFGKQHMF